MKRRKADKSLRLLLRRQQIDQCPDQWPPAVSVFAVAFNCGLTCETSAEDLLAAFGALKKLVLIPEESFALLEFFTEEAAERAANHVTRLLDRKITLAVVPQSVFERLLARNRPLVQQCVDRFFRADPDGLRLEDQFVTAEEERALLAFVESHVATDLRRRSVLHFGREFDYERTRVAETEAVAIPEELLLVAERLVERGLVRERPDQVTLNVYRAGQGIAGHVDSHSTCGPFIAALSLGSPAVLRLKKVTTGDQKSLVLRPRSLLLLEREVRLGWTHAIAAAKSDVIPRDQEPHEVTLSRRGTRVSVTLRKATRVQCTCEFGSVCDSRPEVTCVGRPETDLETHFVRETYEEIAEEFSRSRASMWPKVAAFLRALPVGSLVLDVGCGNGKCLSARPDIFLVGCDRALPLLQICRQKAQQVFRCDCAQLPVRALFDAVLCVAVVHHLATEERRVRALQALVDALRPGGVALVYVWAFEQSHASHGESQYLKSRQPEAESHSPTGLPVHTNGTQFRAQEVLVPFRSARGRRLRFYHVFRAHELDRLLARVRGAHVLDSWYEEGNWAARVQRSFE